jgi:hypothetical protein
MNNNDALDASTLEITGWNGSLAFEEKRPVDTREETKLFTRYLTFGMNAVADRNNPIVPEGAELEEGARRGLDPHDLPADVAVALGFIALRSYPEVIHKATQGQKKRGSRANPNRGEYRSPRSTSPRIHIKPKYREGRDEEFRLAKRVFRNPEENGRDFRLFSGGMIKALGRLTYRMDTEDEPFPRQSPLLLQKLFEVCEVCGGDCECMEQFVAYLRGERGLPDRVRAPGSEVATGVGHVYFIDNGEHIKIGFTMNLERRRKDLRTGSSRSQKWIYLVPGRIQDDELMLKRFLNSHWKGARVEKANAGEEWYDRDVMWKLIGAIKDGGVNWYTEQITFKA